MTRHLPFPPFDKGASPAEYAALNRHTNRMRLERLPDDPPVPLEETIQNLQSIPSFVDLHLWAAWKPAQNEIVALGKRVVLRTEENHHMALRYHRAVRAPPAGAGAPDARPDR